MEFSLRNSLYCAIVICSSLSSCENSSIQPVQALTLHEKNVIEKVKQILGENNWLYRDYMKTDKYLVRWVRDANLNPKEAADNIRKFHSFRKENDIDNILNENWKELERKFEHEIVDGLDNDGAPILLINVGKWNARKEILAGKENVKKMYRYIHYFYEKCQIYVQDSVSINGTAIINLAGFSWKTHACFACIPFYPFIITTLESNYPQMLKHLYLINTPRIFNPIIDMLLPILSPYTSKAYTIYGFDRSEWAPAILKNIQPDLLPPEFGGTRKSLGKQRN